MSYRPFSPAQLLSTQARRTALVLAAGFAVTLAGCDKGDTNSKAIQTASVKLQALAPAGDNQPSSKYKTEVYQTVKTSLTKINGTKAENAAAALLVSQAEAGLAETPVSQAAELERANLNDITEVRALLGQWLGLNAQADAAAAFDPSKEVSEIDASVKAREDERVDQQKQKAAVDQRVAELLAQAKQKSDAAKAKQEEAGKLRSQVANQTAVQGEQTLRQAQDIGRQGDAMDVEAADLEAQAAQVAPQSAEIQLQVDKLSHQKDLLGQARTDVLKRADDAKAQAAQARADAAKVAEEIAKRVDALAARRADAMKAEDQASAGYQAAAKSAGRAQSDSAKQAKLAFGAAQQSLAEIESARAQGLEAYAALLDSLANAKPALPKGDYGKMAEEAHAAAKTALGAATDAYKAADEAYKTGLGASDQERLDRINQKLSDLVKTTSGGQVDIRNPDAPKSDEKPAGTPGAASAPAGDGDAPIATIQKYIELLKAQDLRSVADMTYFERPGDKEVANKVIGFMEGMKKFLSGVKSKFPDDPQAKAAEALAAGLGQSIGRSDFGGAGLDVDVSKIKMDIKGDIATATVPGAPKPIVLKRKDGRWLLTVDDNATQMAAIATQVDAASKQIESLNADLAAGKFPNAQAAMLAFQTRVMSAMAPGMSSGNGPNGKKK